MINNQENEIMNSGFMLVDKPAGMTSHGVINRLRRITGIKKIGHAGTLDPMATGLLIVAIGRDATRKISDYVKQDKEYVAEVFLGKETDTYDREGEVTRVIPSVSIKEDRLKKVIESFKGEQEQVPPMFSAKKHKGKKLYELARKGIEVKRKPARITIKQIEITRYDFPELELRVECSSGTYIRSLAFDIGRKLECGAYLNGLRRTRIGGFDIKKAVPLDDIDQDNWRSLLFHQDNPASGQS